MSKLNVELHIVFLVLVLKYPKKVLSLDFKVLASLSLDVHFDLVKLTEIDEHHQLMVGDVHFLIQGELIVDCIKHVGHLKIEP